MPRIFFAVDLPDKVKDAVLNLQCGIKAETGAVKWVERKNLHITLQFIGEVDEAQAAAIVAWAREAAAGLAPFEMGIGGFGAFPSTARPRVYWAGITKGKEELARLASALSSAIGIKPDKPFSPHITVGRVREGRTGPAVSGVGLLGFTAGSVYVDRFHCIESTLTKQGPLYRKRDTFLLGRTGG